MAMRETVAVADLVYDALRPFHLWAQVAALCALALAAAACAALALSPRSSPRWWLGLGILAMCLLAVAFGARSRAAAYDLRPIVALCVNAPVTPACEEWMAMVPTAQQRVLQVGVLLVVATALGLAATAAALLSRGLNAGREGWLPRAMGLTLATFIAGCGAYMISDGVAAWIQTAYLADIRNAGDGIGELPFLNAVFGTFAGSFVLAVGLAAVLVCSGARILPRLPTPQRASPG